MRLLLIAVVSAAAIWSGYWWFGSRAVESGIRSWLDGRADAGWVANYASIQTRGYPNRFDTTIDDLELADPAEGFAWSAPLFQILRLSYRPNHIIVVWPGEQTFATPNGRITVQSSQARASLVLKPGLDLELERATAVFENITLDSSAGWTAEAAEGRVAVHASESASNTVNLGIEARGLRSSGAGLNRLASAGAVPDVPAFLKLDAELTFDSAWNRRAIETHSPDLTALRLNLLNVERGEFELTAAGELTVDTEGLASGTITLRARSLREMLLAAASVGWVSQSQFSVLGAGVDLLTAFSGTSETLEVPLTLRRGQVSIGLFPLGMLKPLRIR